MPQETAPKESIELRIAAGLLRGTDLVTNAIAQTSPARSWFAPGCRPPGPGVDDTAYVSVRVPVGTLSLFLSLLFLGRNYRLAEDRHQRAVADHVGKTIPGGAKQFNLGKTLSASYEAIVFLKLALSGFEPEFIPETNGRTPDIRIEVERILIECKDSRSNVATRGDDPGTSRKVRSLLDDSYNQLQQFDPDNHYLHVIFLDLPEGSHSMLMDRTSKGQEELMRLAFGWDRDVNPLNGTPFPRPDRVMFSCYEQGEFTEDSEWPLIEPQWIPSPLQADPPDARLFAFFARFLEGFRSDHGSSAFMQPEKF